MHLGAAEAESDLGLAHVVEKFEAKDDSVSFGKRGYQRPKGFNVDQFIQVGVKVADCLADGLALIVCSGWDISGQRAVVAARDGRFDHCVTVDTEMAGEFGGVRSAAILLG
jgi:hypothetical protein